MTAAQPVIHVVDDDAPFRTAVARLLRAAGYQVALYELGDHLLANPPGSGPGCILLDMRMSGLSGLELQDRLAKLDNILPIVFLTGHGSIPMSVQAIKAGAEDFLSKPVSKKPPCSKPSSGPWRATGSGGSSATGSMTCVRW